MNSIKKANLLERNQRVAICKNVFRVLIGQKKKDKYHRYCPSIEGALPAFKHSSNNLKKILQAGFEVYWAMKYERKNFTEVPFRKQFPNHTEITATRWRHSYQAIRETLRSYNLETDVNWTNHLPFLLSYSGAYQGWLEPSQAIPEELFSNGREDQKHKTFCTDLYDRDLAKDTPIIPAGIMKAKMCGPNTPSTTDGVAIISGMENGTDTKKTWTPEEKKEANLLPSSGRPAPIFGEFINNIPPMYIDHDPNILAAFEAVIFIQVETRQVDQLLRNKDRIVFFNL